MQPLLTILVVALITAILRLLPVLYFGKAGRSIPSSLLYLSRVLPSAIVSLLVVYSLKSVNLQSFPFGLPEAAGVLTAVILHQWKRNTLLSVFGATLCYMALIRVL